MSIRHVANLFLTRMGLDRPLPRSDRPRSCRKVEHTRKVL